MFSWVDDLIQKNIWIFELVNFKFNFDFDVHFDFNFDFDLQIVKIIQQYYYE